jgi:copper resistance protein C
MVSSSRRVAGVHAHGFYASDWHPTTVIPRKVVSKFLAAEIEVPPGGVILSLGAPDSILRREFPRDFAEWWRKKILRHALLNSCVHGLLVVLIVTGIAHPVWAHAVLVDSKPKASSSVAGPDLPIWLKFNVRVDGSRSRLHLIAPDGSAVALDAVKQPTPDALATHAAALKPGAYKLQWQVLASDGHISRGEVDFTVK